MNQVDFAVIGTGVMAANHMDNIAANPEARLTAVCDTDRAKADQAGLKYGVPAYYDVKELFDENLASAVVISTPHFSHTPIAVEALHRGLHVLVEKPIAAHAKDASAMIKAYNEARRVNPGIVFASMFVLRAHDCWARVKQMIDQGALGRLVRATWIITDWFRSQSYYDSGGWRATWKGEGGGILLNQCPHNLDLYQWYFGLPARVRGFVSFGKYHSIEVEDEVTALFEHEGGMVGHLIASTAESPGTNRLEVVGELGKLVVEDERVVFDENGTSMFDYLRTTSDLFPKVPSRRKSVDLRQRGAPAHKVLLDNFVAAVLTGEALIAPAIEGHASLSLANAILMSSVLQEPVTIPLDEEAYARILDGLIQQSQARSST